MCDWGGGGGWARRGGVVVVEVMGGWVGEVREGSGWGGGGLAGSLCGGAPGYSAGWWYLGGDGVWKRVVEVMVVWVWCFVWGVCG